jgi:excisionase family DNA binding protein
MIIQDIDANWLDELGNLQVFKPTRVCSLLDISDKTLKRMIQDGRLRTVRLGKDGKSDRVTRESLERLLEEKCTTSINEERREPGGSRYGMTQSGTGSHATPPIKRKPRNTQTRNTERS